MKALPPHELPQLGQRHRWNVPGYSCIESSTTGRTPPDPQRCKRMREELVSSALCVATGLSRDGDGLDQPCHVVGSGLSWKPIAAAFRFSVSSILALILASYSSIDWVTYSSPYLSIL